MDATSLIEIGLTVFLAIAGGIYVGVYLSLELVGQFVEETLTAVEVVALRLLTNEKLAKLLQVAEKFSGGKGGGGILGGFLGKIASKFGLG